jgi:protein-disulfide isomerase
MKMISRIKASGVIGLLLACVPLSHAQFSQVPDVQQSTVNSPTLKPPAAANVAIVEFGDLECPLCAAWNPVLMQAAAKYHVAWVRHDYLIPGHVWSPQAAVNARWFDSKSEKLGSDYRNTVFAQQRNLATQDDLRDCTERFAQAHGVAMPFVLDPQGKLMDEVRADCRLGSSLGVHETPTVWVVTSGAHKMGYPLARVRDINLLYAYLDQAATVH